VQLWLTYCSPFDTHSPDVRSTKQSNWIWTQFVVEHYEIYSTVFVEFLKYCLNTGFLYSAYFDKRCNGPSILIEVLNTFLYPPLHSLLLQIHSELVAYYNFMEHRRTQCGTDTSILPSYAASGGFSSRFIDDLAKHNYTNTTATNLMQRYNSSPSSSLTSQQQQHNVLKSSNKCCHVPLFTQENADRAVQLLDGAWACCPVDFRQQLDEVSTLLGRFFGFQYCFTPEND
jgi:hypothetical protein